MNEALFGIIRADIDRLVELSVDVGWIQAYIEDGDRNYYDSLNPAVEKRDQARNVLLNRIVEAMK